MRRCHPRANLSTHHTAVPDLSVFPFHYCHFWEGKAKLCWSPTSMKTVVKLLLGKDIRNCSLKHENQMRALHPGCYHWLQAQELTAPGELPAKRGHGSEWQEFGKESCKCHSLLVLSLPMTCSCKHAKSHKADVGRRIDKSCEISEWRVTSC